MFKKWNSIYVWKSLRMKILFMANIQCVGVHFWTVCWTCCNLNPLQIFITRRHAVVKFWNTLNAGVKMKQPYFYWKLPAFLTATEFCRGKKKAESSSGRKSDKTEIFLSYGIFHPPPPQHLYIHMLLPLPNFSLFC